MRKYYDATFFCMLNEYSIQCPLHVAYEKCIGIYFFWWKHAKHVCVTGVHGSLVFHWKALRKHCAAIWYEKPEVMWIIYWVASYLFCLCLKRYCWWFGKSWYLNFSRVMGVRPWQSSTLSHRIHGSVIARSMCWKLSLSREFQHYMKSQATAKNC